MRTCPKCGETKPLSEFELRADTGTYRGECKACRRHSRRRRLTPSERHLKWVVGNPDLLRCGRCGVLKAWTEFPRKGRDSLRLQTWCKECFSQYRAERHQRNHAREMQRIRRNQRLRIAKHRALIATHLSTHPCVDCGETDLSVLEFDHVRGMKLGDISMMVGAGYPWAKIEAEIAKCEVRCANCHRRVTVQRRAQKALTSEPTWIYSEPGGA
jgi:hypothetical protein